MSKFLIFKKVPKNEIGVGTEIGILKNYFDMGYIEDPKKIRTNPGARSYPIKAKYKEQEFSYEIKAYETQNYTKDRRLIVNSIDPIWKDREENDYLVFEYDNKITENSIINVNIIKPSSPLYHEINSRYKILNGLFLDENDTLYKKITIKSFKRKPLNQILYGPPGTGKTFNTIKKSLEILGLETGDPSENAEIFRSQLNHRIFFATMHPSYSYEDFVQGLKPEINKAEQLIFKQKDGIFKKVADLAKNLILDDGQETFGGIKLNNEDILRICFFLSKFNEKPTYLANNHLGNKSNSVVFSEISQKINVNPNTLKNLRDKFDYLCSNSRKGWVPRVSSEKLDNTELWPLQDIYEELKDKSFEEVKIIVDKILTIDTNNIQTINTLSTDNYVLILDEINRANISKVFGELITLIEDDKRIGGENEMSILLSSGVEFSVPSNLFIIGTMNTADKSIALVDIALRRRFEFEAVYPDSEIVIKYGKNEKYEKKAFLDSINKQLIEDKGVDFQIGHAYFLKENSLKDVINKNILPLLVEYFRNDLKKVESFMSRIGYPIVYSNGLLQYVNKGN